MSLNLKKLGVLGCSILVIAAALPACGGSDEEPKGKEPLSSGNSGKPLAQLTDAEMNDLCNKVGAYFVEDPGFKAGTCRFAGYGAAALANLFTPQPDATSQKTCTDIEAACNQAAAQPAQPGTCQRPAASCTATVGEIEACATDFRDSVSAVLQTIPACGGLTSNDLPKAADLMPTMGEAPANELPTPPSCKTLEEKCPGASAGAGIPDTAQ